MACMWKKASSIIKTGCPAPALSCQHTFVVSTVKNRVATIGSGYDLCDLAFATKLNAAHTRLVRHQ